MSKKAFSGIEKFQKVIMTGRIYPIPETGRFEVNGLVNITGASTFAADDKSQNLLIITPDAASAREMAQTLEFICGSEGGVIHIPLPSESIYNDVLPDTLTVAERLGCLSTVFFRNNAHFAVTDIVSLGRRSISPDQMNKLSVLFMTGLSIDRDELAQTLVRGGYERSEVVDSPGTFSIRGQVTDIYIPMYSYPIRLIFFDDEIETMHWFDPDSQKRLRQLDDDEEVYVHPVRESILTAPGDFRTRLYELAENQGIPSTKTRFYLERVEENQDFFGRQAILPLINQDLAPITSFFKDFRLCFFEPESCIVNYRMAYNNEMSAFSQRKDSKEPVMEPFKWYLLPEEIEALNDEENIISLRLTGFLPPAWPSIEPLTELINTAKQMKSRGESLGEWLARTLPSEEKRVFLSVSHEPAESWLVKALEEHGCPVIYLDDTSPLSALATEPGVYARRGEASGDTQFEIPSSIYLSESGILGAKNIVRRKKKNKFKASQFNVNDLPVDGPVVHETHGIGLFKGLFRMSPGNIPGDFLCIEYLGGDKLYVPAHRIGLIMPLRGGSEGIKLDKLGGKTWEKTKSKASEKIADLADRLLLMNAERNTVSGNSLTGDAELFTEFEALFPFEETPDQLKAITDVLADLESPRPMDRLICGDVGFGKTEVAMRAAFVAVTSGRQVALMAPTTLLCEQHYRTFSERVGDFPVTVARLSRFTPATEKHKILENVAAGKVDILISTHRILSSDITFKSLGLLIIDEEQKFGVAQKEKFRFQNPSLDVIYLTATPIPRTLSMSLSGLRDISLISTPPAEREPVKTNIGVLNGNVIKSAITRELARGGQVFFVTPRINSPELSRTIHEWATYISELVPEAICSVIHGQMDSKAIENTMFSFLEGRVNVLVSTNIIESGLDISRANTLIVADAHYFGLSQLYQLRGRVGRGKVRASAWFLIPEGEAVTGNAQLRLAALARHTHLGSGFNLSTEDLEIRGSGDLLGAKQTGVMSSVGFDTYVQLVEEARLRLAGETPRVKNDPELNLDIPFYISEDWVPDPLDRIVIYRNLSSCSDETELADYSEVLIDRYGSPPQSVQNLLRAMKLKIPLRKINATGITVTGSKVYISLNESACVDIDSLLKVIN